MNKRINQPAETDTNIAKSPSVLIWPVSAVLLYAAISGVLTTLLPFSAFSQYNLIVHTLVGVFFVIPITWITVKHVQRRRTGSGDGQTRTQNVLLIVLAVCLITGLIVTVQASLGRGVTSIWRYSHLFGGLALMLSLLSHLLPTFTRHHQEPTRSRRRYFAVAGMIVAILFVFTGILSSQEKHPTEFAEFSENYDWELDRQRPFAPSRVQIAGTPWQRDLLGSIAELLDDAETAEFETGYAASSVDGAIGKSRAAVAQLALDTQRQQALDDLIESATQEQHSSGAIVAKNLLGAESCGTSGCHDQIYAEWRPSAHGYSATDRLFLAVQNLAAKSQSIAHTRSCAGCHDPVALLSGSRTGGAEDVADLTVYEGNSCLVCHSIVSTDIKGNGGYVLEMPEHYLFHNAQDSVGLWLNRFLIRSDPRHHIGSYKRPLYKDSEFCAACHRQVPTQSTETTAGLAQEQNEYDSWLTSRWYHEDNPDETIECRECHMPLVASRDPGRGDEIDANRDRTDGKHRSHSMLGGNMYIPATSSIQGGAEHADRIIAWLRGEIEIPEISDKWTSGPVVEMNIVAPEQVTAGELVNLKLQMRNNKTGHDFPAGPLDVLESWVEITVRDNNGGVVLELGGEKSPNPILDTPIAYKADWYDRRGLPVERHDLWNVVGASYRHVLKSGASDVADVEFRCPAISRPRLSGTASEAGPGERNSDVVLSIVDQDITSLDITARLLFRKANPQFLAQVLEVDADVEAPVIELVRATHTVRVVADE